MVSHIRFLASRLTNKKQFIYIYIMMMITVMIDIRINIIFKSNKFGKQFLKNVKLISVL